MGLKESWIPRTEENYVAPEDINSVAEAVIELEDKPIIVDDEMSNTSTNPVQNKAIKQYVDNRTKDQGLISQIIYFTLVDHNDKQLTTDVRYEDVQEWYYEGRSIVVELNDNGTSYYATLTAKHSNYFIFETNDDIASGERIIVKCGDPENGYRGKEWSVRFENRLEDKQNAPFIIDVSYSGDYENQRIDIDVTFDSISQAYNEGKDVAVRLDDGGDVTYLYLCSSNPANFSFESVGSTIYGADTTVDLSCYNGEYNSSGQDYWYLSFKESGKNKQDKTEIITSSADTYVIDLSETHNKEIRLTGTLWNLSFDLTNESYPYEYISCLSFYSGDPSIPDDDWSVINSTTVVYDKNIPITWVGTDCFAETYEDEVVSIFQPSPKTHYDIVLYFNGINFVGMVNGYKPATGN